MRRAILAAVAVPCVAGGAAYGFVRTMARYFDNPLDVLDRIGMETNEYIDACIAAGIYGTNPEETRYTASQQLSPMEGDTP
jgi:hypothetical protein